MTDIRQNLLQLRRLNHHFEALTALADALASIALALNESTDSVRPHEFDFVDLWLEHLAGRFSEQESSEKSPDTIPGSLLWLGLADAIDQARYEPIVISTQLGHIRSSLLDSATQVLTRTSFCRSRRELDGILSQINGAFESAEFCIHLLGHYIGHEPLTTDVEREEQLSLWQHFQFAAQYFHQYWHGVRLDGLSDSKSAFTAPDLVTKSLNSHGIEDYASRTLNTFSASLARQTRNGPFQSTVYVGITQHICEWLLGIEPSTNREDSRQTTLTVLVVASDETEAYGLSATLHVESGPDGPIREAYPDLISMGLLAFDDEFCDAFQDASQYVQSQLKRSGRTTRRWWLSFLDAASARDLTEAFPERSSFQYMRPLGVKGCSASAAFATALYLHAHLEDASDIVVTAAIDTDGKLLDVGQYAAKLDKPLWNRLQLQGIARLYVSSLRSPLIRGMAAIQHVELVPIGTFGDLIRTHLEFRRTHKSPAAIPDCAERWDPHDQPPPEVTRGDLAVDRPPRRDFMIQGCYAVRPVYQQLTENLDTWLEAIFDDDIDRLPIFWIGGPSYSGKSVALLHALAHVVKKPGVQVCKAYRSRSLVTLIDWATDEDARGMRNHLVIGLDEPFSAADSDRFTTWSEIGACYERHLNQRARTIQPVVICSGTAEQRDGLIEDFATEVNIQSFNLPASVPYEEEKELREWRNERTGEKNEVSFEHSRPIGLVFSDYDLCGTTSGYSRSVRARIDESSSDVVKEQLKRLLAFNRLGLGFPIDLSKSLTPGELDFYYRLKQEKHFESRTVEGEEATPDEWLTHSYAADEIYRTWSHGDQEQCEHLLSVLREVHDSNTTRLCSVLSGLSASVYSADDLSVDRETLWTKFLNLHEEWSNSEHGLPEATIPAWIEIRTAAKPKWANSSSFSEFKTDPIHQGIAVVGTSREKSNLSLAIIEMLSRRMVPLGLPLRLKVCRTIYYALGTNPYLRNWPRIANNVLRSIADVKTGTLDDADVKPSPLPRKGRKNRKNLMRNLRQTQQDTAYLADAWLNNYATDLSEVTGLWRTLADFFISRQDYSQAVRLLQLRVTKLHFRWPEVWRDVADRMPENRHSEVIQLGYSWMMTLETYDCRWHLVWLVLFQHASSNLDPDLYAAAVRALGQSPPRSRAWITVWPRLILEAIEPREVERLLELPITQRVSHREWPVALDGVMRNAPTVEISSGCLGLSRLWLEENSVNQTRWALPFNLLWDYALARNDWETINELLPRGMNFVERYAHAPMKEIGLRQTWQRLFKYPFGSPPIDLLEAACHWVSAAEDPTAYHMPILKVLGRALRFDHELSLAHTEILRQSCKRWLARNLQLPSWSYVWHELVISTEESEQQGLMSLAIELLSQQHVHPKSWLAVFVRLLEDGKNNELSSNLVAQSFEKMKECEPTLPVVAGYRLRMSYQLAMWLRIFPQEVCQDLSRLAVCSFIEHLDTVPFANPFWPRCWSPTMRIAVGSEYENELIDRGIAWIAQCRLDDNYPAVLNKLHELGGTPEQWLRIQHLVRRSMDDDQLFSELTITYTIYSAWIAYASGLASAMVLFALKNRLLEVSGAQWAAVERDIDVVVVDARHKTPFREFLDLMRSDQTTIEPKLMPFASSARKFGLGKLMAAREED